MEVIPRIDLRVTLDDVRARAEHQSLNGDDLANRESTGSDAAPGSERDRSTSMSTDRYTVSPAPTGDSALPSAHIMTST